MCRNCSIFPIKRKAIIFSFLLLPLFIFAPNPAQAKVVVDQTKTLSPELIENLTQISDQLKGAGHAELGVVILRDGIRRPIINEQILWVDHLSLGDKKDNELLILIDSKNRRSYIYLGAELTESQSTKNLSTIIPKKMQVWLEQDSPDRAIRVALVQIIDHLGAAPSLRALALNEDLELIQQNPPPLDYQKWIIIATAALALIGVGTFLSSLFMSKKKS